MSAISSISLFGLPPGVGLESAPALARLLIPPTTAASSSQPADIAAPIDPAIERRFGPELAAARAQAPPDPLASPGIIPEEAVLPPALAAQDTGAPPAPATTTDLTQLLDAGETRPADVLDLVDATRPELAGPVDRLLGLVAERVEDDRLAGVIERFQVAVRARGESEEARLARLEARPADLRDILLADQVSLAPSAAAAQIEELPPPPATAVQADVRAVDAQQFSLQQAASGRAFNPLAGPVGLADFAATRPTRDLRVAPLPSRPPINPATSAATAAAPELQAPRPLGAARPAAPGEFARILALYLEFVDTRKIGVVVNELVY